MPTISKFMCCISLETGSVILGLSTLLGAWTVFLGLALLEFKFDETEYGKYFISQSDKFLTANFTDDTTRTFALGIAILLVPIASASLLLLFGAVKVNHMKRFFFASKLIFIFFSEKSNDDMFLFMVGYYYYPLSWRDNGLSNYFTDFLRP